MKVMQKLIDEGKKVDLILTDPPYNMTQNKWDTEIDWEKWWMLIKQIRRDKYTPVLIFGDFPFSIDLINSQLKWYRYTWYWNKKIGTNFLDAAYKPLKVIEHIHVFIEKPYELVESRENWKKKDRIARFYPQFEKGEPNHSTGNKLAGSIGTTYNTHKTQNEMKASVEDFKRTDLERIGKGPNDKHPKNYVEFQKVKPIKRRKRHPTEKPVALLEYLVKTYTKTNDVVLDCFMGSGSTLVACHNLQRQFIGIEIDQTYFDIARQIIWEK